MDESDPKQLSVYMARAVAYLVYAYVLVSEFTLLQGFVLKLLGANLGSSYVDWAYRSLDRVMTPFRGIFESVDLDGNAVLDTSILFAMVIYGLLALLIRALLDWLTARLRLLEAQQSAPGGTPAEVAAAYAAGYDAAMAASNGPTSSKRPTAPTDTPRDLPRHPGTP